MQNTVQNPLSSSLLTAVLRVTTAKSLFFHVRWYTIIAMLILNWQWSNLCRPVKSVVVVSGKYYFHTYTHKIYIAPEIVRTNLRC